MAGKPPPITPVPLPQGVRQILLFGGTFDPPHAAHARLPFMVREQMLGPDAWLLYVPAARNPLKAHGPEASDADRLQMLRLLIADQAAGVQAARVAIWTDELDRSRQAPGPTYTIDTVERLRMALPDAGRAPVDIHLLIGSDQAADFHHWRRARELFEQARPLVMLRDPVGTKALLRQALTATGAWSQAEVNDWTAQTAEVDAIEVSSSSLRAMLHAPTRDHTVLESTLSPAALAYIEKNGLYR